MTATDRGSGTPPEPPAAKTGSQADSSQARADQVAAASSNEEAATAQRAPRRILLVEDHRDALKTFACLLTQMQLNVSTAHDGQQACELALEAHHRAQPYDWILMDMQMPVVDGYEATRRLRAQGYDRPIIAMTAYTTDEDRRECLRFGCNDHISKPIDWNQLARVLEKWAAARSS
jgi:CheY-like chemotaxis protein